MKIILILAPNNNIKSGVRKDNINDTNVIRLSVCRPSLLLQGSARAIGDEE